MADSTFVPFEDSSQHIEDAATLQSRFADRGYLFFRHLIDRQRIERVRDGAIAALKAHGFVNEDATAESTWSGKWPESNELSPDGAVTADIVKLGLLEELARTPELMELLGRVFGGEVFCWLDNKTRIRMMLSGKRSMQVADGPKFSFTTPGHQDYYFFRPVEFCTVWIPLMDIEESVGGLTIGKGSKQEGLHEVWWKGNDYLGVAESPEQARAWRADGGVAVAGTVKNGNEGREWLRSDFEMGDALIFHPLMMHAGIANDSDEVRISADFRYQRQGTQTHWESHTDMVDSVRYFGEVFRRLDELGVKPGGIYEKAWETLRLEGPGQQADYSVAARVKEVVEGMGGGGVQ